MGGMTDVDRAALEALVAPLAELCAAKNFEYEWRVRRSGDAWRATVSSGYPVDDGIRQGPCPCFVVDGPTAEAALARAVAWSMDHARGFRAYSRPSAPPWMSGYRAGIAIKT